MNLILMTINLIYKGKQGTLNGVLFFRIIHLLTIFKNFFNFFQKTLAK